MTRPGLSLVIPVYNEEAVVDELHRRLQALLDKIELETEVVFVNDGSNDCSVELLEALCNVDARYKLVSFSRNFGHQVAITAGIDYASGEAVVDEREAAARATMVNAGRRFLGVARVRAQRPSGRPANAEPRRGRNPRVGARNKWRRIEALRRLEEFLAQYRIAYADWKRGVRDAVFPAGCYAMLVFQGALVADSA